MTTSSPACFTFVMADQPTEGQFEVHWQFPGFTFTCIATSLDFAQIILDFVDETHGNPTYRDIPLGGGVYRHMPEKSVDLSPHFVEMRFELQKLGDADDGYMLRFEHPGGARLSVDLYDDRTEWFLDGIRDIVNGNY